MKAVLLNLLPLLKILNCMTEKYYIGIDGGGSQSTILLLDNRSRELIRVKKGPTNPFSIGMDKTEEVLNTAITEVAEKAQRPLQNCAGICIGSAGIHHKRDAHDLQSRLERHFPEIPIHVTNDYEIALVGGTGSLNGIILISGTGSVAYGRSKNHGFVRAGGWGHLIGDEGSAYYIGKQALISIFENSDNNCSRSLMESLILKSKGCRDLDDLMFWAYKSATKKDIADLALVVDEAHLKGDQGAKGILYNAAADLLKILENIRKRLLFNTDRIPMIISGGVLMNNELVQSKFLLGVREKYSDIYLVTPKHDAAYGAAFIARNYYNEKGYVK